MWSKCWFIHLGMPSVQLCNISYFVEISNRTNRTLGKLTEKSNQSIGNLSVEWPKTPVIAPSLWPQILDNWQHWHKKFTWRHATEVINYFSSKSKRDLTGNNRTVWTDKNVTLAEFCVQFWSLFHEQIRLVLLNSIR